MIVIILFYLTDCRESEEDDDTTRYTKILLTIVCRKALSSGSVDDHRRSLAEIVEQMEREQRRDHLYAYALYELAAEQICHAQVRHFSDRSKPFRFTFVKYSKSIQGTEKAKMNVLPCKLSRIIKVDKKKRSDLICQFFFFFRNKMLLKRIQNTKLNTFEKIYLKCIQNTTRVND